MLTYPKEFEQIVERAKAAGTKKVAVIGANSANILQGVFAAQEAGFAEPILIGNFRKTKEMLEELGLAERDYDFYPTGNNANPVQFAIDMIQASSADVLMRGNIQTRDFLLPIMNKSNHLIKEGRLVTHISVMKSDEYDRLLAVSDCTLLVEPSIEQREQVIRNMTEALKNFGIEKPNIALLSLVEKPSFHMKDTVEAQTIVLHHQEEPIADCNLFGPITYDLIISKKAAELKHFECEYSGKFDGIVVPSLLAGNLICKFWDAHLHSYACGVLSGTTIPVAISGRSESPEHAFLSLAGSIAMANK